MMPRVTFLFIAAFWVVMNVLLWRVEYGAHRGGMAVPPDLVWRKILTAPDASALSIYKNGTRIGFCEFSTSVEQEMAKLEEDNPPPEGLIASAGYQIRINGNTSVGDFTNRLRFDGHLQFAPNRTWRELDVKIVSHYANIEIHSLAAEQNAHFKITGNNLNFDGVVRMSDLQNPNMLLHRFAGNFGGDLLDAFDLPILPTASYTNMFAQKPQWEAQRDHLMLGHETVSVYRLQTEVLQYQVVIYASTLGEILRIELPGGVIAMLDSWGKP